MPTVLPVGVFFWGSAFGSSPGGATRRAFTPRRPLASEELHLPGKGDAVRTTMLREDTREADGGLLARPVTLPFTHCRQPRDWHGASGNHAPHGHVVGFR
jgi:hypothetical protein